MADNLLSQFAGIAASLYWVQPTAIWQPVIFLWLIQGNKQNSTAIYVYDQKSQSSQLYRNILYFHLAPSSGLFSSFLKGMEILIKVNCSYSALISLFPHSGGEQCSGRTRNCLFTPHWAHGSTVGRPRSSHGVGKSPSQPGKVTTTAWESRHHSVGKSPSPRGKVKFTSWESHYLGRKLPYCRGNSPRGRSEGKSSPKGRGKSPLQGR